jgi:hypothetical protein
MQQEPKNGLGVRMVCALPTSSRIRPEEFLRRKLIEKMTARRESRVAHPAPVVRRAV